jgi:hypothetical protein
MSSTLIILKYWVLQYCVRARILVCLPPAPRERIACARVRFGGGGGGTSTWRPVASRGVPRLAGKRLHARAHAGAFAEIGSCREQIFHGSQFHFYQKFLYS